MVKIKLSEWLTPEDLRNGDVVQLLDEGRIRESDETGFSREVFEITVALPSGETKTWTMNKTTQRNCAKVWGDETKAWIDQYVKIELINQNVRGKVKTVIYGQPIQEKIPIEK